MKTAEVRSKQVHHPNPGRADPAWVPKRYRNRVIGGKKRMYDNWGKGDAKEEKQLSRATHPSLADGCCEMLIPATQNMRKLGFWPSI